MALSQQILASTGLSLTPPEDTRKPSDMDARQLAVAAKETAELALMEAGHQQLARNGSSNGEHPTSVARKRIQHADPHDVIQASLFLAGRGPAASNPRSTSPAAPPQTPHPQQREQQSESFAGMEQMSEMERQMLVQAGYLPPDASAVGPLLGPPPQPPGLEARDPPATSAASISRARPSFPASTGDAVHPQNVVPPMDYTQQLLIADDVSRVPPRVSSGMGHFPGYYREGIHSHQTCYNPHLKPIALVGNPVVCATPCIFLDSLYTLLRCLKYMLLDIIMQAQENPNAMTESWSAMQAEERSRQWAREQERLQPFERQRDTLHLSSRSRAHHMAGGTGTWSEGHQTVRKHPGSPWSVLPLRWPLTDDTTTVLNGQARQNVSLPDATASSSEMRGTRFEAEVAPASAGESGAISRSPASVHLQLRAPRQGELSEPAVVECNVGGQLARLVSRGDTLSSVDGVLHVSSSVYWGVVVR